MPFNKIEKPLKSSYPFSKKTSFPFIIVIGIFDGSVAILRNLLLRLHIERHHAAILIVQQSSILPKKVLIQSLAGQNLPLVVAAANGAVLKSNQIYLAPAGKEITISKGRIVRCKPGIGESSTPVIDQVFQSLAVDAGEQGIGVVISANNADGAAGLRFIEKQGGLAIFFRSNTGAENTLGSDYNNVCAAISNFILRQPPDNKVNQKETKRRKTIEKKAPPAINNDPKAEPTNITHNSLAAVCNELQGKEGELSALEAMEESVESKLQLLKIAESISQSGSWRLDLRTNKMIWSDELFKILGANQGELVPTLEAIVSFIHIEDREAVSACYKNTIETGGEYEFQKRITLPDGSIRTIHSQGRAEKDVNGVVNGLVGIFKDITREKQHQEKQEESETYFKGAFDHSAIGMALVGLDGTWKEVNDSTCKLLGYSRQEFMKLTFQDITYPEDLKLDLDYLNELLAGKRESYQMEKRYFHKNGAIIWALLVVSTVKNRQGKVLHFISQIKDISERKKRELDLVRREQQYRSLFDQNSAAVFSVDMEGNITSANNVFAVKTGSSIEQIETMHYSQFVHPDDLQKTDEAFENVKNGKAVEIKIRVFTLYGNELHIILILLPVMVNDLISSVYAIAHDITVDEKAQQGLEKAINDLSKIMAASLDVICTIDEAGRFVQVSAAAETVFGYTPDELVGSKQIEFVYEQDIAATNKAFTEVKSGISKTNFENRYISKSGQPVPIVWSARYDQTDQLIYCIARDATEMKAAESENQRLSYALQKSLNEIYIFDSDTLLFEYMNEGALQNLGYTLPEIKGKTILDLHPDFDMSGYRSVIAPLVEKKKDKIIFESVHQRSDGSRYNAEVHLQRNEYHNKPVFLAFVQDITERKQAELEKEFERKNKEALINSTEDLIWSIDKNFNLITANNAFLKIMELQTGQHLKAGDSVLFIKGIAPATRLYWEGLYKKVLGGEIFNVEIFTPASATIMESWRETNFNTIVDGENIIGAAIYSRDTTDRKKIEEALQSSEEKYKLLFYSSPLPKWIYDIETLEILDVNDPAIDQYGYNRQEFLSSTVTRIGLMEEIPGLDIIHQNALYKKGIIRFGTTTHRKKNADIIIAEMSGHPISFNGRNCMIVVGIDVTEKKAVEKALRLSNERYEYVTRATFDAIWDWDLKEDTIYWGEGYHTLFGHDAISPVGDINAWSKLVHPEDLQRVSKGLTAVIAGAETNWSDEYRYLKANGEYAFVADKGMIVRDDQGRGVRMIGAMQDITRKKREEQQLRLFESVITKTNEGVLIIEGETSDNKEPKILYVNDAFARMTGYSKEEMTGNTMKILEGPKSDQKALLQLQQAMQKGESCDIETIQYRKNGEECWVSFSIVPIADENGWFRHWIAIARDISQRKSKDAEKEVFFNFVQSLGKLELGQAWMNILESVCMYAGFEYAEAWMVNFDQSNVLLNKSWTDNNLIQQIIPSDKIRKVKKGEGLTSKAWLSDSVIYVNDITNHSGYLSKEFALECGLNSAVYIPVLFNGSAIALLSLYSSQVEINNSNFKNLFEKISQQLGPYVQSKKAEDELARFFNLSPDFMAVAGVDGFFKKINPSVSKILGYSQEELFERPISDFTHPEDRELTNSKRRSLGEGNPLLNFENRYLTKNGETRWLSWTSTPLAEEGIVFAVAKDTTEKKKLDEERKRILESISDFFFALDKEFRFTYMNSATEKLFRINPGALIGKNIWEEWPDFKEGIFYESVQQSIGSKTPVSFEFYNEASNSWFEESFYPSDDGLSVFFRSINDRKAAEKALKEAFEEKDTILESIGDAFFALDKNWIVSYWNKMAEQLLKINREDIVGKNLWAVFPDALPDSFLPNYQKAIDTNEPVHFEEFYSPLQTWLEISAYPSHGGLSVYFKDITVRKKAEDSIRTSNERYDMVAKATNDAIWDWDLITKEVTRPGKRLETLFGYDGREADEVDDFWNRHAHPEDWAEVNKKRNKLFENPDETFWEDEYRFLRTNGDYGYVYDKGYIIRNQEGKAIRMIGASQDITREKEQVNEIIRIQQNLDSLINTTTDLIWSINAEFKIIAANKAYSEAIQAITGSAVKEGDSVLLPLIDKAINDKWLGYYTRGLAGETFYVEESFSSPSVSNEWHNIVSFSPIINKNGLISGVACFAKDITELKKAGQKLVELNYSLEKRAEELAISNSELERFAYVASHDLQEPLRMVSSFLQLLQRKYNDQLDDTARKYIHFSVDGAERMKRLINDLLQYSRAGTASLDIVPVDMNEVMADVILLFKNEVHTIDAEIIVDNLPVIYAGKSSMSQLMQNLVGNAIKYRSKEKPVIKISAIEQGDEWVFTIADNGIGIDSKFNEKIFIIFQRLHNKDEFNGTGIGLAICKKIIERYKGKIWVESEFGKGSKFIFALPKKNDY